MTKVDGILIRKCAMSNLEAPFVAKQNELLRNVLQSQLKFIEKYTEATSSRKLNRNMDDKYKNTLRKTANEVALVVSSLGMALDGSLCARRVAIESIDDIADKFINIDPGKEYDELLKKSDLKSCKCTGQLCSNSSCSDSCSRVCWQRYSLDRWACRAVGDSPSVHLDLICDGKLDCYDETDESGCALGEGFTKFEANNMYDNLLKILSTKSNSMEYEEIKHELLTLQDSVKLIQKLSRKRNVETLNIKIIRDECFSTIKNIYDKYVQKNDEKSLNHIYDFLISLNEKLTGALKRSNTGNDRIISSAGCYCTGARCGLPNCSKLCIKACLVEPLLTRYYCGNVKLNSSVPIESICNGKPNCPNSEDEMGCVKEVCRHHHLVLLWHNVQDMGFKHKINGIEEALKSWKAKVNSTVIIAKKNGRITPIIFKDIISNTVKDLVMAYANFDEFRRNINEHTVKEFQKLSQYVIESLKTCGK